MARGTRWHTHGRELRHVDRDKRKPRAAVGTIRGDIRFAGRAVVVCHGDSPKTIDGTAAW